MYSVEMSRISNLAVAASFNPADTDRLARRSNCR